MKALLISTTTNILFYVIISVLIYKIITDDSPGEKPLPPEQVTGYRKFCLLMAIFWPITLIIMLFGKSDYDGI
jgi:hypothetical protein